MVVFGIFRRSIIDGVSGISFIIIDLFIWLRSHILSLLIANIRQVIILVHMLIVIINLMTTNAVLLHSWYLFYHRNTITNVCFINAQ
jgi:hypothetical protein